MQTMEQVSIPLAGPGLVNRTSDNYGPGEYRDLTNLIITPEGTLVKRRPVQGVLNSHTPSNDKIVGSWGSDIVVSSYSIATSEPVLKRTRRAYESSQGTYFETLMSSITAALKTNIDGQTGYTDNKCYYIEGLIQYNNYSYALLMAVESSYVDPSAIYNRRFFIVRGNFPKGNPSFPEALVLENTATPVDTADWNETYPDTAGSFDAVPLSPVVCHFVHKERYCIVSGDTLYLSKATDPSKFLVADDGAFFKFPGRQIKKALAVNDLIYVVFDNSVHVISYNVGPNNDSQVRQISDGIGGEDAVLYGDTIYLLSYKYIYAVNGTNLSKVADLDIFLKSDLGYVKGNSPSDLGDGESPSLKLDIWDDGIYFYLRKFVFTTDTGSIFHVKPVSYGDVFRLDLNNGHISTFTFGYLNRPMKLADSYTSRSSIRFSDDRFYLMSYDPSAAQFDLFYFSKNQTFTWGFDSQINGVDRYGIDVYTSDTVTLICCVIPVELTIPNFSPDGYRYLYRKFRSLQILGDYPSLTVLNNDLGPELELIISSGLPNTSEGLPPFSKEVIITEPLDTIDPTRHVGGYRYGLNQRSKDITVSIKTRDIVRDETFAASLVGADAIEGPKNLLNTVFELVDINVLWSDTRRGPTNSSKDRA